MKTSELPFKTPPVSSIDPYRIQQSLWAIPGDPVDSEDALHLDRNTIPRKHLDLSLRCGWVGKISLPCLGVVV